MQTNDFYRAFEDRFRGSREGIKKRLEIYLPFLLPLKNIYPEGNSIDIGCGRGEWLELLKENHMAVEGVDFDKGMLNACWELGLNASQGDGIAMLREQADESLIVVSAFHVVEHISFEELQVLISEAFRILKPGGLLILETPNPENIKVATESFYVDPTHIKPIVSPLLSFLPEYFGFLRTTVLKLQENRDNIDRKNITLMQVLSEVSPDYAVVAQKKAPDNTLELFKDLFTKQYGLSLQSLANSFEKRLKRIEDRTIQSERRINIIWKLTKPFRWIKKKQAYYLSKKVNKCV
ncbi:MAG: class I SAM-dependent methyltransferase [Epsilonproteobacteria bacterium]|nr:class I SAM-dependent methyltransferase [Campylobacterota bacterium]